MKKMDMVKKVGGIIVSIGVGAIVGNVIKCTTPATMGTIKKVCVAVGSFVLCNMVADSAANYTEQTIDNAVNEVKKMVKNGDLD